MIVLSLKLKLNSISDNLSSKLNSFNLKLLFVSLDPLISSNLAFNTFETISLTSLIQSFFKVKPSCLKHSLINSSILDISLKSAFSNISCNIVPILFPLGKLELNSIGFNSGLYSGLISLNFESYIPNSTLGSIIPSLSLNPKSSTSPFCSKSSAVLSLDLVIELLK